MKELIGEQDTLILRGPASWWRNNWREALVSGNGVLGASFYGGSKHQTVMVSHTDLWHGGRKDELPDVHNALARMREKMDEGRFLEASWEIVNELKAQGYQSRLEAPLPVGDLQITIAPLGAFSHYQRALYMNTGEACAQWLDSQKAFETGGFVSRADDMVLYRIQAEDRLLNVSLKLDMHKTEGEKPGDLIKHIEESQESHAEGEYLTYTAANVDGTDYGMAARVYTDGKLQAVFGDTLKIQEASQVVIGIKVFIKDEKCRGIARVKKELESFDMNYELAQKRHAILHEPLYKSAEITFYGNQSQSNEELLNEAFWEAGSSELTEKLWRFGRYLFISGTREDSNPFALYGLWSGSWRPMWPHNMANENLQMIYWHCFTGNLASIHEAVFRYYNQRMDEFRENARKLFGCRGIFMTAGTTPGISAPNQIVPVIMNWTGAAGWLAQHYTRYARYKKEESYRKEWILPYLNEVAEFYEDFITFYPDGRIKIYPSVSPENTPVNFMPPENIQMAHPMPTTINSTIDLAIVKEFFSNMLILAEEYDGFENRKKLWKKILDAIPPYRKNELGAVKEWQEDCFSDRYDHRHLSHIYPVFPGYEVNSVDHPEEMAMYKEAVRLRKIDAQTGWSMAHMAAIYARFDDGEMAMECLDNMAKACLLPNFFTLHNDWRGMGITLNMDPAPVQLDAVMGYVNAVQEMLFYTSPTLLKLLPALPGKLSKGSLKRFRYADGSLDMEWDRKAGVFQAVFSARAAHKIRIQLPGQFKHYQITCQHAEASQEGSLVTVSYEPGGKLLIETC